MTLGDTANNFARQNVEVRVKACRAMLLVIVRMTLNLAWLEL